MPSFSADLTIAIKFETHPQQDSETAQMASASEPPQKPKSSRTSLSKPHNPPANQSQSEPRQMPPAEAAPAESEASIQYSQAASSLKRKRESLQGTSVWRPYVSPYAPLDPPNRVASSLPNTPVPTSVPNMILPASASRDSSYAPLDYVQQRENQHIGLQRQHHIKNPPPRGTSDGNGYRGYAKSPVPAETGRDRDINEGRGRAQSDSLSPSAQLLLHSPSPEPPTYSHPTNTQPEPRRNATRETRKSTSYKNGAGTRPKSVHPADPPDTPLIDKLPRQSQKQIYGIIGGLQNGIRSCQQQAENMQKQLDLLQAALGIDVEDGERDVSISVI
jgi:hypothetical protein